MTVRDLRDCLFEVKDQEQEIDVKDIGKIMALWERYKDIDSKVDELIDENVSRSFIMGWQKEKAETLNLIRVYKA